MGKGMSGIYNANMNIQLSDLKECQRDKKDFLKRLDMDIELYDKTMRGFNKRRLLIRILTGLAIIANVTLAILSPINIIRYGNIIMAMILIFYMVKLELHFRGLSKHLEDLKRIRHEYSITSCGDIV